MLSLFSTSLQETFSAFKNDNFFNTTSETFAAMDSSIRVQPGFALYQAWKKKPRGGSRGAMTRSLSGR